MITKKSLFYCLIVCFWMAFWIGAAAQIVGQPPSMKPNETFGYGIVAFVVILIAIPLYCGIMIGCEIGKGNHNTNH
jgi:hypothetical protein